MLYYGRGIGITACRDETVDCVISVRSSCPRQHIEFLEWHTIGVEKRFKPRDYVLGVNDFCPLQHYGPVSGMRDNKSEPVSKALVGFASQGCLAPFAHCRALCLSRARCPRANERLHDDVLYITSVNGATTCTHEFLIG